MAPTKTGKKASLNPPPELLAGANAQRQGRLEEAEAHYHAALKSQPKQWQALHQLGTIHLARGELSQALQFIGAAMKANAASPEVTSNYGVVLRRLNRDDEAIEYFNRALLLKPGYVPALLTRGASFHRLGRREEALSGFDRVIELDPANAKAHYNRANILHELRRFDEALDAFKRADELSPNDPDVLWNKALTHLLTGDYEEGWKKYEWRLKRTKSLQRDFTQPLWLGEQPIAGKTILVHAEQGFGDTLQFARYLPLLAEHGAHVILEVQPPLKSLFVSLKGVSTLLSRGDALPPFDVHCPIASLPLAFATKLNTIPWSGPYLSVAEEKVEAWRAKLPNKKFKIAVACSGSPGNEENDIRSIPIQTFAPLFADERIQWLVVQRDMLPKDAEYLARHPEIRHIGQELSDFSDTAAIVTQCDLVISVCTSLAHLAGALGLPFWMLSKYSPDFRWLLDRSDSPWYPTARIFRQPSFGDWNSVVANAGKELEKFPALSAS